MIAVITLVMFSRASADSDIGLTPGKAHEHTLVASQSQSYGFSLQAGDLVEISVKQNGGGLIAIAYGPSAKKIRGFRLNGNGEVHFIAETTGRYRLDVGPDEKTKEGTYSIEIRKIITLADRQSPPLEYESPTIKALRIAVENGRQERVMAFWEEMKKRGAPLVEPLKDGGKNMLVTFLWKGDGSTRNVILVWTPFTNRSPRDYEFVHLAETDVWYKTIAIDKRTRLIYRLAPNVSPLTASDETAAVMAAASQIDPLNPKRWLLDPDNPDVPEHQGSSVVEMPDAPAQPWVAKRSDISHGTIEKHQFQSALLKNEREIAFYLPPGYSKSAKPYGLVVLFDESAYLDERRHIVPTPTILDNLIAENRIPPVVAILISNPPGDTRARELPCNPVFADFLNFELLPWARRLYNFTADPRYTVVGGSSYGGLAAAYAALRHPETFGNVLSQSGSYWWTPPRSSNPADFDPDAEPNWMATQFVKSPRLPVRFYMDAGTDEIDLSGHGGSILVPNRHLRDVLLAKGYEVHYREFVGGHDYLSWRGTLADGLILLIGAVPIEQK